ncbi:MAG: two pore domain potassium channel family protein [Pseudolabrys sp.]|nr:two pore domain potassium channel family protein [Pseudolabrys sp.]
MSIPYLGAAFISLLNFAIHALFTVAIVYATRHADKATSELGMFERIAALLTITMVTLMIAHVVEIFVWAGFYDAIGLTVTLVSSLEFAFENYTALGYGDALPPPGLRLLGPINALNGLLLIGWSVAIIFEVLRMAEIQFGRLAKSPRKRRK